jgi:hypothetical protein
MAFSASGEKKTSIHIILTEVFLVEVEEIWSRLSATYLPETYSACKK